MTDPESNLTTVPAETSLSCCAETVNSAISLWTELEVLDDDEDLYTYRTLDTADQKQLEQQQQQDRRMHPPSTSALRGCSRAPTIVLPSSRSDEQQEQDAIMMDEEVDPTVQWQEEAYWMSFQSAVRSFFSNHQAARTRASHVMSTAMTTTLSEDLRDDDDTDMSSSFQGLCPTALTSHGDGCADDVDGDGIPPCIPRTVITPTASLASGQLMNISDHHHHMRGGSVSLASSTAAASSSSSATRRTGSPRSSNPTNPYVSSSFIQRELAASPPKGGPYGEIRRSLRELVARAAIHRQRAGPPHSPPCPCSHSSPPPLRRRGDPRFAISSSLAGPTLEEMKGLRWKMRELAEHAAIVAKGENGAERYVIGASAMTHLIP